MNQQYYMLQYFVSAVSRSHRGIYTEEYIYRKGLFTLYSFGKVSAAVLCLYSSLWDRHKPDGKASIWMEKGHQKMESNHQGLESLMAWRKDKGSLVWILSRGKQEQTFKLLKCISKHKTWVSTDRISWGRSSTSL